ncbi:hypothetical protein Ahy_B08g091925 [Arachis hypogaea]|uniref:Peptidase S26 domain-containing protein n=1 Tax=Arachis hypogaea TaxID=3818 RepID=A0A444Y2V3_ARAHY|nr:hypothetical protein Ahy_B08g091925 [Arachis hypogaea]
MNVVSEMCLTRRHDNSAKCPCFIGLCPMPKGHVWIQGDNIFASHDSRHFGPVPYGLIQGKVFFRKNFMLVNHLESAKLFYETHLIHLAYSTSFGHLIALEYRVNKDVLKKFLLDYNVSLPIAISGQMFISFRNISLSSHVLSGGFSQRTKLFFPPLSEYEKVDFANSIHILQGRMNLVICEWPLVGKPSVRLSATSLHFSSLSRPIVRGKGNRADKSNMLIDDAFHLLIAKNLWSFIRLALKLVDGYLSFLACVQVLETAWPPPMKSIYTHGSTRGTCDRGRDWPIILASPCEFNHSTFCTSGGDDCNICKEDNIISQLCNRLESIKIDMFPIATESDLFLSQQTSQRLKGNSN